MDPPEVNLIHKLAKEAKRMDGSHLLLVTVYSWCMRGLFCGLSFIPVGCDINSRETIA